MGNEHLTVGAVRFAACAYAGATKCGLAGYPIIDCVKCKDYREAGLDQEGNGLIIEREAAADD